MTASRIVAPLRRLPLDILFAQACLGVFMAYGFGALPLSPRRYGGVMAVLGTAAVLLAPRRARTQIPLSVPILLLLAWWLLSYTWATTAWSWTIVTWRTIPALLALIAIAAIVPVERAAPGLLTGCYVAMAWTLLALVMHPTAATTDPRGSIGWRGSFANRNTLAMFLALALPTIATLERRRPWKVVGLAVGLGLLIMSRSVTGLLTTLAVAGAGAWLWMYRRKEGRPAGMFATTTIAIGIGALALALALTPLILPLMGKDGTLTGRTRVWEAVWSAIQVRPLGGYGVGVWLDAEHSPVADIDRALPFKANHSHNGPLELLFELGAVGAVLYLAVVLETLTGAWRRFWQRPDLNGWTVLVGVMMVTTSITEPPVLGPWLALLAYAQIASKASALRQSVTPS